MRRATASQTLIHALLVLVGLTVDPAAPAQSSHCLADPRGAASGDLGYQLRSTRCEGLLQRYVASSDRIDLVGFQAGEVDIAKVGRSLQITAIGPGPHDTVTLRALSLTSKGHYQMDTDEAHLNQPFPWPGEVLQAALTGGGARIVDPAKLGLLGCSRRCTDRPDTVYWPVAMDALPRKPFDLVLLFRAEVRTSRLSLTLERAGDTSISISTRGLALSADVLTAIALPKDLPAGFYKADLEAREDSTRAPLGGFHGVIYVP